MLGGLALRPEAWLAFGLGRASGASEARLFLVTSGFLRIWLSFTRIWLDFDLDFDFDLILV